MVDSIPSEGEAAAHVHASPEWTWTGGRGTSVADSIPLEGEAAAHVHASPEWNCMAEGEAVAQSCTHRRMDC